MKYNLSQVTLCCSWMWTASPPGRRLTTAWQRTCKDRNSCQSFTPRHQQRIDHNIICINCAQYRRKQKESVVSSKGLTTVRAIACLPQIWPGFDSGHDAWIWVEFVGFLPRSDKFFTSPQKPKLCAPLKLSDYLFIFSWWKLKSMESNYSLKAN